MQAAILVLNPIKKLCNKDFTNTNLDIMPTTGGDIASPIDMQKNEVYGLNLQQATTSEQQSRTSAYEEVPSQ